MPFTLEQLLQALSSRTMPRGGTPFISPLAQLLSMAQVPTGSGAPLSKLTLQGVMPAVNNARQSLGLNATNPDAYRQYLQNWMSKVQNRNNIKGRN